MRTGRRGKLAIAALFGALTLTACGTAKNTLGATVAPGPSTTTTVPSPVRTDTGLLTGTVGEPCGGLVAYSFPGGTVAAVRGTLVSRTIAPGESVEVVPNGLATQAKVGLDGQFRIALEPGRYVLHVVAAGRYTPSGWPPAAVLVRPHSTTRVEFSFDCKMTD